MIDENINENVIVAFIDTSALDPMYIHYKEMQSVLNFLKKHIETNKIILLTHEIVMNEIKSHIVNELGKKIEEIEKIQKSKELYLLNGIKEYSGLFNAIDEQKAIDECFKTFKNIIKDVGFHIISLGNISVKALLKDYFAGTPPFGTKNKKSEFPDAIMLQSLSKSTEKINKVHIIAKDKDWKTICENNEKFTFHKDLSEFLDYINKDNEVSFDIRTFLKTESAQEQLTKILKELLEDQNFNIDGKIYDRKGIIDGYDYDEINILDIKDVGYKLHTIEDIDIVENENRTSITSYVTIVCSANIEFSCKYLDESQSMWDNETHDFIIKKYGEFIESHEVLFPVRLKLSGDYKKEIIIEGSELLRQDDFTALAQHTLIKREIVNDYYDDFSEDRFVEKRVLKCPYCQNDITIDLLSGDTQCVSSHERQMGMENEYEISIVDDCPHCGNLYRVSGYLWEYPINCCNLITELKIEKEE